MDFYWRKEWTTPAVVGVVSFAAGVAAGAVGYKVRLDRQIDRDLAGIEGLSDAIKKVSFEQNIHIPESKDLDIVDTSPGFNLGQTFAQSFAKTMKDLSPKTPEPEPEPDAEVNNVFQDDWDVAEEMASRSPDAPYVLHINEFVNRDSGYHQQVLEWYMQDQILADENNVPIYSPEKIVGRLEWGRGSKDEDTVYIRNDKLHAEYEIHKNPGSFQEEVYGVEAEAGAEEDELKHSNRIPRFRVSD